MPYILRQDFKTDGGIMAKLTKANIFRLCGVIFFMTLTVVFTAGVPVSCRLSDDGFEIVKEDSSSPKILSYIAETNLVINILYSEKINLRNVKIRSLDGMYEEEAGLIEYENEENRVKITLKEPTEVGINYALNGMAEDVHGNLLQFSLPFTGFNDNPVNMVLSEIRTKHTSTAGVLKKAEYIELYVAEGGNTAGFELICGSDGENKKYVFPIMDVKKGEYIVVHFRTPSEGLCIDETGEDLCLSTAEASSESRDLWIENTETRISDSDVIVLRNAWKDEITDAVLFCSGDKTSWYSKEQKSLSQEAFDGEAWAGGSGVEWACSSDGVTSNRTLCRFDFETVPAGKDSWHVVTMGTPGCSNENCVIYN